MLRLPAVLLVLRDGEGLICRGVRMRLLHQRMCVPLRWLPAVLPPLDLRQVPALLRLRKLLLLQRGDPLHGRRPEAHATALVRVSDCRSADDDA